MTNDINKKVINIFSKHKNSSFIQNEEEKILTCEDGYPFVCLKKDKHGKIFDTEKILEQANECEYIVKVLIDKAESPYIYNFKISGKDLLNFLKLYLVGEKEGEIIEIDKYYPEDLA